MEINRMALQIKEDLLMNTKFIRRLRIARGLTQKQLADACDMSRQQIGYIERGDTGTHWSTLLVILERLGCRIRIEDVEQDIYEVSK
jgi:transcriptional regulator with XRE-family HTH domain